MILSKRMQDAFFMFAVILTTLSLSACVTRPVRSSRHGLLDDGRFANQSTMGVGAADEDVEIHLSGRWQWPLKSVDISSPYGNRGHKFHQGVDFRAPMRTPVLAANDGVVVYVGTKIRGYGKMVVIKHEDNFYTVYAHHSKNLVKNGKVVKRGETIALSGKSGHSTGPHLHFEIRQGTESYNPIFAINENVSKYNAKYGATRNVASENKP